VGGHSPSMRRVSPIYRYRGAYVSSPLIGASMVHVEMGWISRPLDPGAVGAGVGHGHPAGEAGPSASGTSLHTTVPLVLR
jgi:hypothetical protein